MKQFKLLLLSLLLIFTLSACSFGKTPTSSESPSVTPSVTPSAEPTVLPSNTPTVSPLPKESQNAYLNKWWYNYFLELDLKNKTHFAGNYETIYKGFEKKRNVNSIYAVNEEFLPIIYKAIIFDNPDLFYFPQFSPYFFEYGMVTMTEFVFQEDMQENRTALMDECSRHLSEVTKLIADKPDVLQKVQIIHDYLFSLSQDSSKPVDNSMLGCLSENYSPGDTSWALAFKYICNCCGIQCEIAEEKTADGEACRIMNVVNLGETIDYKQADNWSLMNVWSLIDASDAEFALKEAGSETRVSELFSVKFPMVEVPEGTALNPTGDSYTDKWGYNYYLRYDVENGTSYAYMYKQIYDGILEHRKTINIKGRDIFIFKINTLYNSVIYDNPELFTVSVEPPEIVLDDNRYLKTLSPQYYILSNAKYSSMLQECRDCVAEVAEQIEEQYGPDASKLQKVKVIHDYLVSCKRYRRSDFDQTIAGCLTNEYTPVCTAFAMSMKYLCNCFGIQCEVVEGTVREKDVLGLHAWNIVNLGDNVDYADKNADYHPETWYEMDVTWDNNSSKLSGINYTYFNVTTKYMLKSRVRDLFFYEAYPVEKCLGEEYSFFACLSNGYFEPVDLKTEE